jgi:hypothetical protein
MNNFILSSRAFGRAKKLFPTQPTKNWERRPTYLGKNDNLHGTTGLQG